jgi:hypothetical protein
MSVAHKVLCYRKRVVVCWFFVDDLMVLNVVVVACWKKEICKFVIFFLLNLKEKKKIKICIKITNFNNHKLQSHCELCACAVCC